MTILRRVFDVLAPRSIILRKRIDNVPMRPHGAPNGPPRGTGAQCTQEQPLVVGYGRQLMLEAPQSGHPHQPASRGTR